MAMLSNLKIPIKLRRTIDRELQPGERLRWVEQPIARFFTASSVRTSLFGVLWTAIALFWSGGVLGFRWPDLSKGLQAKTVFALVGLAFAVIGLELILTPFWSWHRARHTAYLVTDQRALTIQAGRSTEIRSFSADQLSQLERRERADGSGDVIIGKEIVMPMLDSTEIAGRSESQAGPVDPDPTTARLMAQAPSREIGFLNVRNPRESERALRQLAG